MKIVVQKFGGTSVATAENREYVLKKVQQALEQGFSPVVVVSAMGRKGDAYATDTLIDTLKSANLSVHNREMDMMMCCGEILSACVMAATLQKAGIKAIALTGGQAGIVTDSEYGSAHIKNIRTSHLLKVLEDGMVPVVCGFQGMTENKGNFTTLGRGGSDTSAAALGVALHAELVEIYTDVEGIMTADPRIVQNANVLDAVSYQEVAQMAHNGAKVIHPRAVELAMSGNVPLVVKSTFSDGAGTLISNSECKNKNDNVAFTDKLASGIANMGGLTQFRVALDAQDAAAGQKVFQDIAAAGISVSFLNLSEKDAMFATFSADTDRTCKVLKGSGFEFVCNRNCAKVTVVLAARRGMYGLMAKFVNALTAQGIGILQTVDSDNTISAIIKEEKMTTAVQSLHKEFSL